MEDLIEKKECSNCKTKCSVESKFCDNCNFDFEIQNPNIDIAPCKSIFNFNPFFQISFSDEIPNPQGFINNTIISVISNVISENIINDRIDVQIDENNQAVDEKIVNTIVNNNEPKS